MWEYYLHKVSNFVYKGNCYAETTGSIRRRTNAGVYF